jgi:hypothetical protein
MHCFMHGTAQANMEVINANPKLAGIDLERILTPAAQLRPDAAQRCVQMQARACPQQHYRCCSCAVQIVALIPLPATCAHAGQALYWRLATILAVLTPFLAVSHCS